MGSIYVVAVIIIIIVVYIASKHNTRISDLEHKTKVNESNVSNLRTDLKKQISETTSRINREANNANRLTLKSAEESKRFTKDQVNALSDRIDYHLDELTEQLNGKFEALSELVESLSVENSELKKELIDLRKKVNFVANIEEDAKNLNEVEDTEERAKQLELARKQLQTIDKKSKYGSSGPESTSGEEETTGVLDSEQLMAREYMEKTHKNVFITGKAGTGKSFLLQVFVENTEKSHVIVAPTGIAALNVGGATLHSTFGYYNLVNLDIDDISEDTIKLKAEKRQVLQNVEAIIIDEVSMVRADTFDKIDRILRVINHNNELFGGKQIFVFGDLFQLPPIAKGGELNYLNDRYGGIYFFCSDAYRMGNFKFIELTINHRQKEDKQFFEILNHIREGKATQEDVDALNSRYTETDSVYDTRYTTLFPTKAEAEKVNQRMLSQIEAREYTYCAKVLLDKNNNQNRNLDGVFPIMNELKLKVGALVMMVANDYNHRWVNGTLGIVKELGEDYIIVAIDGNSYDVQKVAFDEQEPRYQNGRITYETIYSVEQYPIVPAYAMTIHKSQGKTYKTLACDINNCFENGQAYVALSRCASLEGLHLKSLITETSIMVDKEILDFYRSQTRMANNVNKETVEKQIDR